MESSRFIQISDQILIEYVYTSSAPSEALTYNTLNFGVDLMRDNVDLCKKRLGEGSGNIYMGNTLDPHTKLKDTTKYEYKRMVDLFGGPNLVKFME